MTLRTHRTCRYLRANLLLGSWRTRAGWFFCARKSTYIGSALTLRIPRALTFNVPRCCLCTTDAVCPFGIATAHHAYPARLWAVMPRLLCPAACVPNLRLVTPSTCQLPTTYTRSTPTYHLHNTRRYHPTAYACRPLPAYLPYRTWLIAERLTTPSRVSFASATLGDTYLRLYSVDGFVTVTPVVPQFDLAVYLSGYYITFLLSTLTLAFDARPR